MWGAVRKFTFAGLKLIKVAVRHCLMLWTTVEMRIKQCGDEAIALFYLSLFYGAGPR